MVRPQSAVSRSRQLWPAVVDSEPENEVMSMSLTGLNHMTLTKVSPERVSRWRQEWLSGAQSTWGLREGSDTAINV